MAGRKQPDPAPPDLDDEDDDQGQETREYNKRTQPIEIKGLPDGVRAVLRLKPWREAKEFSAYIYRREADPLKPGRVAKKFLRKVYNTEVEESYLQANFPRGGKFTVIYQLPHTERAGDVQIHSDDFEIEPGETAGALVAPGAAPSLPAAPAAGGDLRAGIASLRELAEVVAMLQGNQPAGPAAPAWMEKMYQDKLRRLDELEEKLQKKLTGGNVIVSQGKPADEAGSAWPEFLRPFAPQIKAFGIQTIEALAGKLLGGGIESAGLRFLVLNNPTFQALWADEAKRNEAASAIIGALGEAGENLVSLFAQEMAKRQGGPQ